MKLTPTCREVARAVSSGELVDLPPWRRLFMRWHLFVCRDCRRYARQIAAIGRSIRDLKLHGGTDVEPAERLQSLEAKILEDLAGGAHRRDRDPTSDSPDH